MYAGIVHSSVKRGSLEEAAKAWREAAPPAGEGQPGYKGALLLVEPGKDTMVGIGLWESKRAMRTLGPAPDHGDRTRSSGAGLMACSPKSPQGKSTR